MSKEMLQMLDKYADKLGKLLGKTGTEFYALMQKQAMVYVVTTTIEFILLIIANVILAKMVGRFFKWVRDNPDDDVIANAAVTALIIAGIVIIVFDIISLICVGDYITALVNPKYWALQQIISQLKGCE